MANGGNPEEAVDAYRRALELKPTFTRAIFNLGVACQCYYWASLNLGWSIVMSGADCQIGLNIGVHKEAAEHCNSSSPSSDRYLNLQHVEYVPRSVLIKVVLAALSMHTTLREEDAKVYDSLSIWSTLRRALVAMVSIIFELYRTTRTRTTLCSLAIGYRFRCELILVNRT